MLVLGRKAGQSIALGDRITVRVVAVRGSSVRLGIEAPSSCCVLRGEILEELRCIAAGGGLAAAEARLDAEDTRHAYR